MSFISKSKLKANMFRVFRDIEKTGEELIVTDRNRPVLRIQPIARKKTVEEAFGSIRGKVIYREDVDTPTAEDVSSANLEKEEHIRKFDPEQLAGAWPGDESIEELSDQLD